LKGAAPCPFLKCQNAPCPFFYCPNAPLNLKIPAPAPLPAGFAFTRYSGFFTQICKIGTKLRVRGTKSGRNFVESFKFVGPEKFEGKKSDFFKIRPAYSFGKTRGPEKHKIKDTKVFYSNKTFGQ
jgi:hypothetical protein